jgi:hypothetical protein
VAIALIFLVGCQAIHVARLATAASKVKNCKYEIQESTEYLSILGNGHYLAKLDGKNLILPTEPQLADTSYPSDEEVNKLILIQNKVAQCRVGAIESFANVEPGVIPTLVEGYKQADERELNLIAKKTTWGEYAKQCVQNYNYSLPKFQKAFLEADRVREREADETMETVGNITGKIFSSTLQVALAALSAWSTQQQAMYRDYQSINNTNRFLFTDCTARKLGSSESISCSTH